MQDKNAELKKRLFRIILSLKDEKECEKFFYDICTYKELDDLALRLEVASRILEGQNYNDISSETGVSTSTVSRVARAVKYGTGGYGQVLDKK